MTEHPFDLRALVRDVMRTTDALGPDEVAEHVYDRIPERDREAALVQGLVEVARQVITRTRVAPIKSAPARPIRSSKVAGIRAHARALRDQVAVGAHEYRYLRDCTFDDLQYAAEVREGMAAANAARAAQYRALAELLDSTGATTVGDLSEDQVEAVFDNAA